MNDIEQEIIKDKIRRIFPGKDEDTIFTQLCSYGTESYEKEKYRVYLAILKLSEEDGLPDPIRYIEAAKQDYRDVLYWAEYPNEAKSPTFNEKDPQKIAKVRKKDKEQYEAWFKKS